MYSDPSFSKETAAELETVRRYETPSCTLNAVTVFCLFVGKSVNYACSISD
jgi:hypothetical protein